MSRKGLLKQILFKCAFTLLTILIIVSVNFALIHLAPGSPVLMIAGEAAMSDPEYLIKMSKYYGLDKPIIEQYFLYLQRLFVGDLGYSWRYNERVAVLILERIPATLLLTVSAMVFAVFFGIFLGVYAARRPYSTVDNLVTTFVLTGYSIPIFWLGLMLILLFSVNLGLLPIGGMRTIGGNLTGFDYILDVLAHLLLPTVVLGTRTLALVARLTRANMLYVLGLDYIVTARSKGLSERRILFKHALKNAFLPVITIIGLQVPWILGGALLTETTFSWPGMGRLMYESLLTRDYPLIMGILVVTTIVVVAANLLVDIAYAFIDPRIRITNEG
jgi:peptide/nickel transport system permease protein